MSGSTPMSTAEAVNEIEGYLLWEAEKERARDFSARLPWLTRAQQAEVEQQYQADQLEFSRACLRRIAARSGELRAEYEGVYRVLRRRLLTGLLVVAGLLVTGAVTVAVALTGG
ncbi:hypothetical protein [Streptomyces paromomycinus]|uniref:Cytochrome C oxidase subunit I n=1 Tax=Streptomyces paromomycinus TaxID=92743 RepID=A0A401WA60_STREY|nr:hypothetical protein [Streptomyces paromomycinus]GCD46207.1 hypothetical protein GKJPGBOP_05954 [Streptomyces paromomycinus]